MKQLITLLVTLGIVGSCCAQHPAIQVEPCPGGLTYPLKPTAVSVFNATWACTTEPCIIYKHTNLTVTVTFENMGSDTITALSNSLFGTVLGITAPYPDYPANMKDVCTLGDASSKCPINKGDKYTEKVTLPVPSIAISGMSIVVKWELVSGSTQNGCFEFLLKVG